MIEKMTNDRHLLYLMSAVNPPNISHIPSLMGRGHAINKLPVVKETNINPRGIRNKGAVVLPPGSLMRHRTLMVPLQSFSDQPPQPLLTADTINRSKIQNGARTHLSSPLSIHPCNCTMPRDAIRPIPP